MTDLLAHELCSKATISGLSGCLPRIPLDAALEEAVSGLSSVMLPFGNTLTAKLLVVYAELAPPFMGGLPFRQLERVVANRDLRVVELADGSFALAQPASSPLHLLSCEAFAEEGLSEADDKEVLDDRYAHVRGFFFYWFFFLYSFSVELTNLYH